MRTQKEPAEVVKKKIIKAATELFAKYGIDSVGIRRIASEAGINHALIIRYFESKDGLVTEILKSTISALIETYPGPLRPPVKTMPRLREILRGILDADRDTMKLIIRSELDGLSPESYVDPNKERAANLIAKWIKSQQKDEGLPDAKLVSLVIVGAMFSFASIAPWLMTAVGLSPEDFDKRREDILDVLIWIVAQAIGLLPDENN